MQKGLSPNATTRLPLGNPLHGYAIALEIEIIDALGAGTLDILVVMVTMTSFISNSEISSFPFKCLKFFKFHNHVAEKQTVIFLRSGWGEQFSDQAIIFSVGWWKNFYFRFASCVLLGLLCTIFSCVFLLYWNIFWLLANPCPAKKYNSPHLTETTQHHKFTGFSPVTENTLSIPELFHIFFSVRKRIFFSRLWVVQKTLGLVYVLAGFISAI